MLEFVRASIDIVELVDNSASGLSSDFDNFLVRQDILVVIEARVAQTGGGII